MDFTTAKVTILGTAPYTQSHMHSEPKLEGEQMDAYDLRTWRSRMNTAVVDGQRTVIIPQFGLHMALASAARYSKKKIVGQGNATWTAKFEKGIAIPNIVPIWVDPEDVQPLVLSLNADGVRGSGKRVVRRLPSIPAGWEATFGVVILDPIVTEAIFREMAELAGLSIGLGQYRPENGGSNGRFVLKKLVWQDNRQTV